MTLYPHDAESPATSLEDGVREALAAGKRVGVLVTHEDARLFGDLPVVIAELGSGANVEAIAARLYSALRELDAAGLDVILVRDFSDNAGLWRAVRDRLRRASARYTEAIDESAVESRHTPCDSRMPKSTLATATPLRSQLDRLADFEPTDWPVLSLYLDMRPGP